MQYSEENSFEFMNIRESIFRKRLFPRNNETPEAYVYNSKIIVRNIAKGVEPLPLFSH